MWKTRSSASMELEAQCPEKREEVPILDWAAPWGVLPWCCRRLPCECLTVVAAARRWPSLLAVAWDRAQDGRKVRVRSTSRA